MPDTAWLFSRITPVALLDILVVAAIFFWLLSVAQGTRALPLIRGVLFVIVLLVLLSTILPLTALRWLLSTSLPALLLTIPIVFQPELRRGLEQLGHTGSWLNLPFMSNGHHHPGEAAIEELVRAAGALARQRIGALIVIERDTGLQDYADKGVLLDAQLTSPLLINIFFKNSPLHDGAVIVRGDRLVAARCIMPLAEGPLPGQFGTRHRAALGISEESDALALIVSEETGDIALAHNGQIDHHLTTDQLREKLRELLGITEAAGSTQRRPRWAKS
jgi:diadenylate cyclase